MKIAREIFLLLGILLVCTFVLILLMGREIIHLNIQEPGLTVSFLDLLFFLAVPLFLFTYLFRLFRGKFENIILNVSFLAVGLFSAYELQSLTTKLLTWMHAGGRLTLYPPLAKEPAQLILGRDLADYALWLRLLLFILITLMLWTVYKTVKLLRENEQGV